MAASAAAAAPDAAACIMKMLLTAGANHLSLSIHLTALCTASL
jgi:hypothetical protein